MPWTSIYLTSLKLDGVADDLQNSILYAIYHGPCGLKCKDPSAMCFRIAGEREKQHTWLRRACKGGAK